MKILDDRGRLFGKLSILDLGAGLVILIVIIGIFFYPGSSGSIAQINTQTKQVEVDILVRGLGLSDPESFAQHFKTNNKASIIVRNQPAGEVDVILAEILPRTAIVPQPDGSVKALPNPRPELNLIKDAVLTVKGEGQITSDGAVLGSQKIKIGSQIEVDSLDYYFRGNVTGVRKEN
ncbi:MAG: DUF4330 domain-containing protein [Prochloraceae cyanobacterium]